MDGHPIVAIGAVEHDGPFTLRLQFDDGATKSINFEPILYGNLYGPLRDPDVFRQVALDPDFETLVWPNGADFDPASLRYWEDELPGFLAAAERWKNAPTSTL